MNLLPWVLDELTPYEMDDALTTAKAALRIE